MTGPATPGQEGPSFAPPPLPEGWIAQWDGNSKKYYFVQLSTRVTQWEIPTHSAHLETNMQLQNLDSSQSHARPPSGQHLDESKPNESSQTRSHDETGETNDRSLKGNIGKFAMNQLLNGGSKKTSNSSNSGGLGALAGQFLGGSSHSGSQKPSSSGSGLGALAGQFLGGSSHSASSNGGTQKPNNSGSGLGALAGQFLGGSSHSAGNNSGTHQSNSSGSGLGALAGQFLGGSSHSASSNGGTQKPNNSGSGLGALAGQFLGGGKKPTNSNHDTSYSHQNAQTYQPNHGNQSPHSNQPSPSNHGGLLGTVGGLFSGKSSPQHSNIGFGYSQSGSPHGPYSGSAPQNPYQQGQSSTSHFHNPNGSFPDPNNHQNHQHNQNNQNAGQQHIPPHSYSQSYGMPSPAADQRFGKQHTNYGQQHQSFNENGPPPYQAIQGQPMSGHGYGSPQYSEYASTDGNNSSNHSGSYMTTATRPGYHQQHGSHGNQNYANQQK